MSNYAVTEDKLASIKSSLFNAFEASKLLETELDNCVGPNAEARGMVVDNLTDSLDAMCGELNRLDLTQPGALDSIIGAVTVLGHTLSVFDKHKDKIDLSALNDEDNTTQCS